MIKDLKQAVYIGVAMAICMILLLFFVAFGVPFGVAIIFERSIVAGVISVVILVVIGVMLIMSFLAWFLRVVQKSNDNDFNRKADMQNQLSAMTEKNARAQQATQNVINRQAALLEAGPQETMPTFSIPADIIDLDAE